MEMLASMISLYLVPFLQSMTENYPVLFAIFAILGSFRSIFKPLFSMAHAYVESTESDSDDKALAKFEASKAYKILSFLVDYIFSVKLKKK